MTNVGILSQGYPDSPVGLVTTLNPESVKWHTRCSFNCGSTCVTPRGSELAIEGLCKLSLLCILRSRGWAPGAQTLGCYALGGPTNYVHNMSSSRMYFLALAKSSDIFSRFPKDEDHVPFMLHGMHEQYYKLLLKLRKPADFLKLQQLQDDAVAPKAITDAPEFTQLLAAIKEVESDDETKAEGAQFPDPSELALPAPAAADVADLHKKAVVVLAGASGVVADVSSSWTAVVDGQQVRVHFDNCTHSSGHQRAYVACPLGRTTHPACFKYTQVNKHAGDEHAVAWLACWYRDALANPGKSKRQHRDFLLADADVREVLSTVSSS